MARKKSEGEKPGSWMDTYGDMVTLLLTFFVMLYASSSFDEAKWQYILQAFTSKGDVVNPIVAPENPNSQSDKPYTSDEKLGEGDLPQTFDQLYQYLAQYVDNNKMQDNVEVTKGASNIYIRFKDKVFFSGDSSVLLKEGQQILSKMGVGIKAVDSKILGVKVGGHTAVASYSKVDDQTLAAQRAVSVVNYLKNIKAVSGSKLVSEGYGEYRPVAPNNTEANRSKNRRVEIIIIRKDADYTDPAVIDEFIKMQFGTEYVSPDTYAPVENSTNTGTATTTTTTTTQQSKENSSKKTATTTSKKK